MGTIIFWSLILSAILNDWTPFALTVIGLLVYPIIDYAWKQIVKQKAEENNRKAQAVARQAREIAQQQYHINQQNEYFKEMIDLGEQSIKLFEETPKNLYFAEKHLNQAKIDFTDNALSPFWNSIEKAAEALGRFNQNVNNIEINLSHYIKLIKEYKDTPPQFPLARQSIDKLGVSMAIADRMNSIVRTAQCNPNFAIIYEQRRTNQILVAGFNNLAQALDKMTWQITSSIDGLAGSVDVMTSSLNESTRMINLRIGDIAEKANKHHDELMKSASEGAKREKKALEMLDNIQHGRPLFL